MRTTIIVVAVGLAAAAGGFFAGRFTASSGGSGDPLEGGGLREGSTIETPRGSLKVLLREGEYVLARDGAWTDHHPGGAKKSEAAYVDGTLDGPATYFHKNGKPREKGTWRKGKKHGRWTGWNPDGAKTSEAEYRDGLPAGPARTWDASGNLIAEQDLLEKARVGGKYRDLVLRFKLEADRKDYGDFKDFGYFRTTHYKGIKNIPTGYWVYVYPYWHVWREKVE